MEIKETDCAYLAATIEGEGCIIIDNVAPSSGKPKSGWRPTVHVTQKGREWIDELYKIFPGQIITSHSTKHKGQFRISWTWGKAYEILEKILPYMRSPKKKQAELVLRFHQHILDVRQKGDQWNNLSDEEREWRLTQLKVLSYLKKNVI